MYAYGLFFFSSRRRHTRLQGDWSSDVCSSDLKAGPATLIVAAPGAVPVARGVTIPAAGLDVGVLTLTRPGDAGTPRPGPWTIDPSHSTIAVTGQHLGLSRIHGRFRSFSGELVIADPLGRATVDARIDADSIDTGNGQRDDHLRSADFLDVAQF